MLSATYAFVFLFCSIYFFRPNDLIPGVGSIPFAKIAGILVGGSLIVAFFTERLHLEAEGKLLLLLFGYLCLCIPFSTWKGGSFQIVVQDFSKVVLVAIASMAAVTTTKRLLGLLLVQVFAMLTMATLALSQANHEARMYGVGRLFADPNDFALNLCIVLPICVALVLSRRRIVVRIFWILATGLILFAIISTSSRGGFLALITATIAIWRRFHVRAGTALAVVLVITSFAGLAVFMRGASSFYERMGTIVNPGGDVKGSAQAREELLIRSVKLTFQHPLFGIGPGQFAEAGGMWHVTHNSYTQLSSEAGIPSLVFFLAMVWSALKKLSRTELLSSDGEIKDLAAALHSGIYAYLVGAFFLSTAYWFVPYLLFGYASAAYSIAGAAASRENNASEIREHSGISRRRSHLVR